MQGSSIVAVMQSETIDHSPFAIEMCPHSATPYTVAPRVFTRTMRARFVLVLVPNTV